MSWMVREFGDGVGRGADGGLAGGRSGWLSVGLGCLVLCVGLGVGACQGRGGAVASPTVDIPRLAASYAAQDRARASASAAAAGVSLGASPSASASATLSVEAAASRQKALGTVVPERLEGMDDNTPQGAAKSAQYFLKLYTYAFATGDTSQLAAMSDDECVFCNSVIKDVKEIHGAGGWVEHWDMTVDSTSYKESTKDQGVYILRMVVTNPTTLQYSANGEARESELQEGVTLKCALQYNGKGWIVKEGEGSK